jgi:uncharacterized membrane protein YbhN (UPF0104 family)
VTGDCRVAPPAADSGRERVRRRNTIILRAVTIVAVATCLYFFIRGMKWAELANAFADAKLWPILVAAVLNFGCLLGKAVCWRIMLAPRYTVKTSRLFRLTVAAFAASVLVPARVGEVFRVWVLKRRDGIPVAESAAVAFAEKLLDGASLLLLVAPILWLLPGLPSWVGFAILVCSAVAIGLLVGLYIAAGRVADAGGGRTWFGRFIAGMHVLRDPKRLVLAFATLVLVWGFDLAMVDLVLYATGIDLPLSAGLLILFTLNLTIMVPSTPAQVGTLELGAIAATQLLGVPDAPALAFALLYHGIQIIPLVIVGLSLEHRMVLGRLPTEEPDGGELVKLPNARAG